MSDHSLHAALREFDIDCQDALPVSIAFTDNPRIVVSGERNSNRPGGRLSQYSLSSSNGDNVPKISADVVHLDGIDHAVVSKDGKWIVIILGTSVRVRNMTTDEVVEVEEHTSGVPVHAVDISPDSTKLATGSQDKVVRIFSINTGKLLLKFGQHGNSVLGVRFSLNGEYLATAALGDPVRVWNTRNGYALLQTGDYSSCVNAIVQSQACIPLGWSTYSDRVFTISSGAVSVFHTSSKSPHTPRYGGRVRNPGTMVQFSESIPADNNSSLSSFATNGRIVACAAGSSLSFWDTFSFSKICQTITFQDPIISLALSPDDSYLACGRADKKITIYLLRDILPLDVIVDPISRLPFMTMNYETLQPWIKRELDTVRDQAYYDKPNHALIRTHSQEWSTAVQLAKETLAAEPSIIGYITLGRALVGQGKQELAFEAFDAVFRTCSADENIPLLLIKAILLFLSGKRENAVTRVKGLISSANDGEKYDCYQVLGNMYLNQGDWKDAFESFEHANALSFFRRGHHLMTILLIFGPSFEEREITLRHPLRGTARLS